MNDLVFVQMLNAFHDLTQTFQRIADDIQFLTAFFLDFVFEGPFTELNRKESVNTNKRIINFPLHKKHCPYNFNGREVKMCYLFTRNLHLFQRDESARYLDAAGF